METVEKRSLWWLALPALCFIIVYYQVIARLIKDWITDDNYSHGWLIVPIALYFIWERRAALKEAECKTSYWGLVLVLCCLAMLLAGILGSEMFISRVSMLGVLLGSILFLFGWNYLRILFLPIVFLLLMIPIPSIIFNHIAFPLQLLASQFGESALIICNIPVLREGNVIKMANTTLEVAEACSGIRSLISLLTIGIVYGYFIDSRLWVRIVLALGSIPIAIFANGIRVAGTGIAAHYYGEAAAQGFFHTFSGWIIFIAAFIMMFVLYRVITIIAPKPKPQVASDMSNKAELAGTQTATECSTDEDSRD